MGKPNNSSLARTLSMEEKSIREHLSLVDVSTPQEVKKAVERKFK